MLITRTKPRWARSIVYIPLFFCLLISTPEQVHAQQLSIGQIPFQIGMTRQEANSMAHDPIYLDDTQSADLVAVREKHGESYILIGTIGFRDGRVVRLTRDLKAYSAPESHDVGNVLFEALERLKSDNPALTIGMHRAFVSSEYGEMKTLILGNGIHRIELTVPGTQKSPMVAHNSV